MKAWLAACAALLTMPAYASGLVLEASVLQPIAPFDLKHATPLTPVLVEAVTADGQCSIHIEFARFELLADDNDASLSGRVKQATCGRQVIDSGFANGSFHLVDNGMAQLDSTIEVVLMVDE